MQLLDKGPASEMSEKQLEFEFEESDVASVKQRNKSLAAETFTTDRTRNQSMNHP